MVTIRDIARAAGVSMGTVSNVINNKGNVSSEKICLVQEAAERLGYNMNLQARRLRGDATNHVAVILPNIEADIYSSFYSTLNYLLRQKDYQISLHLSDNRPDLECECYSTALSYRPSAVVAISCLKSLDSLYKSAIPTYFVDLPECGGIKNASFWHFDYEQIAQQIIDYTKNKNYKRLTIFADTAGIPFDRILARHIERMSADMPFSVWVCSCDLLTLSSAAFDLVSELNGSDLILATNNLRFEQLCSAQQLVRKERAQILPITSIKATRPSSFPAFELDYRKLARLISEDICNGTQSGGKVLPPYGVRHQFPNLKLGPEQTLTLITLSNPTTTALRNLAPQFERHTGARLIINELSYHELYQELQHGTTDLFDLVRMDMVWRPTFEHILCADLEPYRERAEELRSRFLRSVSRSYHQNSPDSRIFPLDPSTQMLFYRRDLFENTTIQRRYYEKTKKKLTLPVDFDSFNEIAAFFTRALNPESPVEFGALQTYGSATVAADDFLPRLYSYGGSFFDRDGKIALDTPEMRRAIDSYIQTKCYTDNQINGWWGAALEKFAQGNTAMAISFYNYAAPFMNGEHSQVIGKVGAAPTPGNTPLLGGGCIGISRSTKKAELCLDFLDWLYSDETAIHLTLLGGLSPCRAAFESEDIYALVPWLYHAEEHFNMARRNLKSPLYQRFDNYLFETILGMAVRSIILGMGDTDTILRHAQKQCETELGGGAEGLND